MWVSREFWHSYRPLLKYNRDFATQERPVPNCSVRLGYFAGNCYKTFLGSPRLSPSPSSGVICQSVGLSICLLYYLTEWHVSRHAHCGSEIPRTSNMRKNPSATFGLSPRFSDPPPYPPWLPLSLSISILSLSLSLSLTHTHIHTNTHQENWTIFDKTL